MGYSSGVPVETSRVIEGSAVYGNEVIGTPSSVVAPPTSATFIEAPVAADSALLVVNLPADAQVFVNGEKTAATGGVRRFVSRGLAADKDYEFVVKMVVNRDGSAREEMKKVTLSAGGRSSVTFGEESAKQKTSLTLHVPADARVWLAGNETSSTGATRLFETSNLRSGQTWQNYEIRVATVVDGREKVVSKTINLVAGGTVELSLDPAARTASTDATVSLK